MLEFYEVNELEKKWEEYNKNKKQFSFLKSNPNFVLKFDKTILGLLLLISVAIGAIFWLLKDDEKVSMASINQDIEKNASIIASQNVATTQMQTAQMPTQPSIETRNDYNITAPAKKIKVDSNADRPTLSINDVGVLSSEDSGGFKITNTYENQAQAQNFGNQNFNNKGFNNHNFVAQNGVPNFNSGANNYNQPPQNEIIDFGKAPLPPKSNFSLNSVPRVQNRAPISSRLEIKTSNLSSERQSLESKFYSTKKIEYSLSLAEDAYNKKDYDNAIKWALTSNEIDKNNVISWIIFAKANYKKGRKDDAIYALETFNSKAKNGEISKLIDQIKSGTL